MQWKKTVFDGLEGYEIDSDGFRMAAVSACGPRIAFLGRAGGENLLYWEREGVSRGEWKLRGGHRVWLTRPMADESEDTYLPDNAPCRARAEGARLTLTAPESPVNRLERGMRIEALGGGAFRVTNFVRNAGDLIYSGGVWSPTCVKPEGRVLRVPLGEDAAWDIVHVVIPRVFAGHVTSLEDDQAAFRGNDLIVTPRGRVAKRCVAAPQGVIELSWPAGGVTFTKRAPYVRGGSYPLGGCNLAVFVGKDNWMAEMESFGCEQPILPGQTVEHTELWELKA